MNSFCRWSSALSCAALICCVNAFGHSATEPVPRPDGGSRQRHDALNQRAKEAGEKAQVIFVGDSITQGWEGAGKEIWEERFARWNAVNLGIGGDRTQHVLWRLDNGNIDGLKPKAAVLMIGTNNSNGEDNSPGQIAEGIAAIVKKLREKLPQTQILLVAIFPRSENFSPQRGKILQVNQVIRRLADGKNVHWIDFGHRFVSDEGLIPASLMPDYLHLSREGYQIWADEIQGKLSAILGEAAGSAKAGGTGGLTGDWIWTIAGPDGNPIDAALVLKAEGGKVTGRFARDAARWLEIEDGKVDGDKFSWTVKRDRPDGSIMKYQMTGKLAGGKIEGQVKTEIDGTETETSWTARRK